MDKSDRASRADGAEFLDLGVGLKRRWQLVEKPAKRIAQRFDFADTGRIETCFARVLDVSVDPNSRKTWRQCATRQRISRHSHYMRRRA